MFAPLGKTLNPSLHPAGGLVVGSKVEQDSGERSRALINRELAVFLYPMRSTLLGKAAVGTAAALAAHLTLSAASLANSLGRTPEEFSSGAASSVAGNR